MASVLTASRLRASRSSRLTLRLLQTLNNQGSQNQQCFSLVELMVVIVIIGILSAVALPQFLGVKDKAKLNTQIAEAGSLAKECAAALISEGPYPAANFKAILNQCCDSFIVVIKSASLYMIVCNAQKIFNCPLRKLPVYKIES